MLQVVLKSYGYYDGKIDGQFGNKSTKALILFQGNNNLSPDGVVGYNTCTLFLNKSNIKKYEKLNSTNINNVKMLKMRMIIFHKKFTMLNLNLKL